MLWHIPCDRFRTQDVPHVPQQSTLNGAAKSVNIAYDRLVRIENFLGNLTRLQQMDTRGIPLERRSYWDLMQQYGKQLELPKAKRRLLDSRT